MLLYEKAVWLDCDTESTDFFFPCCGICGALVVSLWVEYYCQDFCAFRKVHQEGKCGKESQIILVGMRKGEADKRSIPAHCQVYMPRQNYSNKVMLKKKKVGHIYWWILFKLSVKFRRKIKRTVKEIHTILSRYWAFHLFFRKDARVPESFTNTLSIILLFSRNHSGNRILWCVAMLLKCCFSFSWTLKKWCRLNSVWNKE